MNLYLAPGSPEGPAWCEGHALPHVLTVPVFALSDVGVGDAIGTYTWCDLGEGDA